MISSDDYDQVIKYFYEERKRKSAGDNRGKLVYERIRIESLIRGGIGGPVTIYGIRLYSMQLHV
jgi:hypothetical protein